MQLSKTKALSVALLAGAIAQSALAQQTFSYPAIYPFVPKATGEIYKSVRTVTEDKEFEKNFRDIVRKKLSKAKTKQKPWTSSYWPMNKGLIADPFEESAIPYYLDIGWVAWKDNYNGFKKRLEDKLKDVDSMSEEDLEKLAPSEKYDLLLGDKTFDLTRRLWDYSYKWGSKKENAFITKLILVGEDSLDLANDYISKGYYSDVSDAFTNSWNLKETLSAQRALELVASGRYDNPVSAFQEALEDAKAEGKNYVLEKKNSRMAAWEGICNGWSTAAGLVPRPRRSVKIKLPNGKNLKFFPSDIKGLAALYYVNSLIQDPAKVADDGMPYTQGTVSAGLRCNLKNAKTDIFGRLYDNKDDPFNTSNHRIRDSRCSGVHPAIWHMGLVNLIGKQGRSFVVERKVGAAVDNHPMYAYEMEYYNPNNGRSKDNPLKNVIRIDENDIFKQFRNPKAKYIVGVETTMIYMDYSKPNREDSNTEEDDSEVEKRMYYDLELDANYNIVGGQWRALKYGAPPIDSSGRVDREVRLNHNQPDFFWTITRDYKKTGWFGDVKNVEPWTNKRVAPPKSWAQKAKGYHAFEYQMLVEYGNAGTCRVKNETTDEWKKVYCEQSYNRPQPMINVLNGLIELSK